MKYKQGKYPRNINMESVQEIETWKVSMKYKQGKYPWNINMESIHEI